MIVSLHGLLEAIGPDWVVVTVGGVGLKVSVPASLLPHLGPRGASVHLHTHLVVREDSLDLYGFSSLEAVRLFTLLLTVSGIGPKLALSVLSALSPEEVALAIASGDVSALARAPGVGRKTAGRIVLDLQERLVKEWGPLPVPAAGRDGDVIAALLTLGYTSAEASRAVAALPKDAPVSLEERVRLALQHLARL